MRGWPRSPSPAGGRRWPDAVGSDEGRCSSGDDERRGGIAPHPTLADARATFSRKREKGSAWLLIAFLSFIAPAHAVEPGEMLKDPVLESRARTISADLRCLVCQNESIDESHADLARDIRLLVRQRLIAGDSDSQVRDYLVARYGQFILLRPPFEAQTLLLWGTPLIVLALGAGGIVLATRRRRPRDPSRALSDDERGRLDEILADRPGPRAG